MRENFEMSPTEIERNNKEKQIRQLNKEKLFLEGLDSESAERRLKRVNELIKKVNTEIEELISLGK